MAVNYLTSNTLIASIKRKAIIPTSTATFTNDDFLALANDEVDGSLVPWMLSLHEDYFIFPQDIPLESNTSSYAIPYRAIGNKFKDLAFRDNGGNLRPMVRILPEDRYMYQKGGGTSYIQKYYIQGNDVMLVPDVQDIASGSLVFLYYLRPNELVTEDRVAIISDINVSTSDVTAISTGAGTVTITSVGHDLMTSEVVRFTNTDSTPAIDDLYEVTVVDSDNFTITATVTVAGTTGTLKRGRVTISNDVFPTNLTADSEIDFLQSRPGHKTYNFDITLYGISADNSFLYFDGNDIPTLLREGDHIATSGECIIPQIPSDMHNILAEKVAARCLEALGDTTGLKNANEKIQDLEHKGSNLIENRADSSPFKVVNNWSHLRQRAKNRGWF